MYHTQSKSEVLGVSEKIIRKHTVVSQEVAEAHGSTGSEQVCVPAWGLHQGNAGPSKGDSDAEVGTVWIAIATKERVLSEQFLFGKHRQRVVGKAVNKALEMVYKELI